MKLLTASERKAAHRRLGDADWRLRNLYWIRDEGGRRVRFRPYAVQERLLRGLKRRCLVLKGRQMRVTTAFCLRWLDLALWRPDMKIGILRRLERVADKALAASTDSAAAVREHTVQCEGRDATNAERFESIKTRLKNQDRILWAIISVMGAVATSVAVVTWDVLKAKLGIG